MGFLTSRLKHLKERLEKGQTAPAEVSRQVKEAVTQAKEVAAANTDLVEAAKAEAAQQYMAKMAKIDSAHAALALDHLATIAEDEENTVRRYREKTVFGGDGAATSPGISDVGRSLILADNISYNEPQLQPQQHQNPQRRTGVDVLPWVLVAALTAGGLGAAAGYFLTKGVRKDPDPVVVADPVGLNPGGLKIEVRDHTEIE